MLRVLIAVGGIAGTYLVAWALFGGRFVFPRWKRWGIGAVGVTLAVLMWAVHPNISGSEPDGSSLADQWP